MKTGLALVDLDREITRQANAKRDLLADTRSIEPVALCVENGEKAIPKLVIGSESFAINEVAHDQIGAHAGIDARYYDKCRREAPELWAENVRTWFNKYPAVRMVRTLDQVNRAFLSDTYQPLENYDFAKAVLPVVFDMDLAVMSAQITEKRLYIKCVDKRLMRDVPIGRQLGDGSHVFYHTLSPAVILRNSETGHGYLEVEYGVYTEQCTNLASIASGGMKRRHVGKRNLLGSEDEIRHLLTDQTKSAMDQALWLQVRDVMKGAFEEAKFQATVDKIKGATEQAITSTDIPKVVEVTAKRFGFNEAEKGSILKSLIVGADLSKYGLFNAITATAETVDGYDRASEIERIGGDLIDLPASEWKTLAEAA